LGKGGLWSRRLGFKERKRKSIRCEVGAKKTEVSHPAFPSRGKGLRNMDGGGLEKKHSFLL